MPNSPLFNTPAGSHYINLMVLAIVIVNLDPIGTHFWNDGANHVEPLSLPK